MILLIDNYDSFVFNLSRYVRELGGDAMVRRNDDLSIEETRSLHPSHIIISPGPCTPAESGVSNEIISAFGATIPILGVCLGHQCIGAVFGGKIVRAQRPTHGKTSEIRHQGGGVFAGLPNPFRATRYHSLAVSRQDLPGVLLVTAETPDGEIMGLAHREYPVFGVQFHPESVLTECGHQLLLNFLHVRSER
jgi:anthranilate synthase/aminodeoxychorismate synthase-like glutamine amidotransferase